MIDVSIDLHILLICAFVAALVSLWQFYPMCRKLRKALETIDINEYYAKWHEETMAAIINKRIMRYTFKSTTSALLGNGSCVDISCRIGFVAN